MNYFYLQQRELEKIVSKIHPKKSHFSSRDHFIIIIIIILRGRLHLNVTTRERGVKQIFEFVKGSVK